MSRSVKARAQKSRGRRRTLKKAAPRRQVVPLGMSVEEFCAAYTIRRNLFYELLKAGKAPDTMQLGRRRVITYAAAERWQQAREAEARAAAIAA